MIFSIFFFQLHIRKTKAVKKEVASTTEDITNTEILEPLVVEPQSSSHETSPPGKFNLYKDNLTRCMIYIQGDYASPLRK